SFYRDPGADEMLRPQDVPARLLDATRAFHFGSISLYSEPAAGATRAAADKVRAAGGLVSYDPNLRPAIMATRHGALEAAQSAIPRAHVIKVSSEEVLQLSGMTDESDGLAFLFDHGIRLAAVTRGPDGATVANAQGRVEVAGEPVSVVDTTGAGDAFTAGLLTFLLERDLGPEDLPGLGTDTLARLGHWANRVAASSTTRAGATEGLIRPD
ncbi:MAG: PfkB family carbohydrate kinase, partial [Thiohalorhabdaceae bacterium]